MLKDERLSIVEPRERREMIERAKRAFRAVGNYRGRNLMKYAQVSTVRARADKYGLKCGARRQSRKNYYLSGETLTRNITRE